MEQLNLELDDYHSVKDLYDQYTDNHPTMHCNRFATWEELDKVSRSWWSNFLRTTPKKFWYQDHNTASMIPMLLSR